MKTIKFFFWVLTHWHEYEQRRQKVLALFVEQLNNQDKYKKILIDLVKKNKKIPKQYALDYIAMRKIKTPWHRDKQVINRIKQAAKLVVKNEVLNGKN